MGFVAPCSQACAVDRPTPAFYTRHKSVSNVTPRRLCGR